MERYIGILALVLVDLVQPLWASQVVYQDIERNDGRISIFMDRKGNLYPPEDVHIDTRQLLQVPLKSNGNVDAANEDFGTLKALFRFKAKNSHDDPDWIALLHHTGVSPKTDVDFDRTWEAVQAALRLSIVKHIEAAAPDRQVVLLIHGFNNNYEEASAWYEMVERDFRKSAPEQGQGLLFVRMYWDGLSGKPYEIWTMAQNNGPWVGLELRRLLHELGERDGNIPLRIFTHSSGAFVITNALGDGSSAFPKMGEIYRKRAAGMAPGYELPTKLKDLRVAMLVPAQPLTAFNRYYENSNLTGHGDELVGVIPQRIILGLSKKDLATAKGDVLGSCNLYGGTCMATEVEAACNNVWRDLRVEPPRLVAINFTQPASGFHKHSVRAYMDDPEWAQLRQALFAKGPGRPQGMEKCTGPAPQVNYYWDPWWRLHGNAASAGSHSPGAGAEGRRRPAHHWAANGDELPRFY